MKNKNYIMGGFEREVTTPAKQASHALFKQGDLT